MTPGDYHWQQIADRHRRAKKFAEAKRSGMTWTQIADRAGVSHQRIVQIMKAGCPPFPFDGPAAVRGADAKPAATGRPAWSYPDETTLRIVREARDEIARNNVPPYQPMEME